MKYLIANWKMNSVDIDTWEREFLSIVSSHNNFPKSDEVRLIVCLNLYDYTVFSEKIKINARSLIVAARRAWRVSSPARAQVGA